MIKQKLEQILSLNGISILIGIVGGIFGIISVFVNWETQISIKWFAALWIIYSFFLIISVKLTYDISKSHSTKKISSKILQFSRANLLLLVENNNNLEFSQTVSIYYTKDNFQLFFANGYVQNIQEKLVQIKVISFDDDFINLHNEEYSRILNNESNALSSLLINNYLRYNG